MEEERRLSEREARVMGATAGAAGAQAHAQGTPGVGEAQAIEKLQRAGADVRRSTDRVKREERDSERQEERSQEDTVTKGHPRLLQFRQAGIPQEAEREMQERAWARIRGETDRLEEKDRELAVREPEVREQEAAAARRGPRVIPDPEGDSPPTDRV